MIRVPFGNYQSGAALLHRLDPRTKIIGISVLVSFALIASDWIRLLPLGLVTVLAVICSGTNTRTLLRDIRSLTLFYILTVVLHSFLTPGEPLIKLPLGLTITLDGISKGFFFSVKIVLLATLFGPLMRTTHPAEWGRAIDGIFTGSTLIGRVFRRLSIILGLAMRFLPTLVREAERIRWAQVGRGLQLNGNIIHRVKSLIPLIMPLLAESIRKAEQVTLAMQARGFNLDAPRSDYKPLKMKAIDIAASLVVIGSVTPVFL